MKKMNSGPGRNFITGETGDYTPFSIVIPGPAGQRFNLSSDASGVSDALALIQLQKNSVVVGVGTGFLIDADILLTAKHVFSGPYDKYSITVGYDRNASIQVNAKTAVKRIWHNRLDLSVILLHEPEDQWFELSSAPAENDQEVTLAGYGFDYYGGGLRCSYGAGPITNVDKYANQLSYLINTYAGDSGGPVYRKQGGIYEAVGVHSEGAGNVLMGNRGVLLTASAISDIQEMIAALREWKL